MPLAVLGVVRLLRGEARGAWLAGASLAAQFLCCIYYGVFLITVLPVIAGVEWLRTRPPLIAGRCWCGRRLAGRRGGASPASIRCPYQRARAVVGDRPDSTKSRTTAPALESYVRSRRPTGCWGWTAAPERRRAPPLAGRGGVGPGGVGGCSADRAVDAGAAVGAARGGRRVDRQPRLDLPAVCALLPPYRGLRVPARFGGPGAAVRRAAGGDRHAPTWRDLGRAVPRGGLPAAVALLAGRSASTPACTRCGGCRGGRPPVYRWLGTVPPTVIVHCAAAAAGHAARCRGRLPVLRAVPPPPAAERQQRLLSAELHGHCSTGRGFPDRRSLEALRASRRRATCWCTPSTYPAGGVRRRRC